MSLKIENIFILFAPGLGGNHLANLLATDNHFQSRAVTEDYNNNTDLNAHVKEYPTNDITCLIRNNGHVNSKGNVFAGHFGEFYWAHMENKISKFKHRQIIVIEIPQNQKFLSYKRYSKYLTEKFIHKTLIHSSINNWNGKEKTDLVKDIEQYENRYHDAINHSPLGYMIHEQCSLYSANCVYKLFNEKNILTIPSENIFKDSIDSIYSFCKFKLHMNINYKECEQMQNIWIEKIKKYVNDD